MTETLNEYKNIEGLIKIAEKPEIELSNSDFKELLEYILDVLRNGNKKNINLFVLVKYTKSKIENIMANAGIKNDIEARNRVSLLTGFTRSYIRELYKLSSLITKYNKFEELIKEDAFSRDSACFIIRIIKKWEDKGEEHKINKLFEMIGAWKKYNGKAISKNIKLIIENVENGVELEVNKDTSSQSKDKNEIDVDLIIKEYPEAQNILSIIENSINESKAPNNNDLNAIRQLFFNIIDNDIVTQGSLVTYFLKQIEKAYDFKGGALQTKQQKILSEILDIHPQFIKTRNVIGNYDPRIKTLLKEGLIKNQAVNIINRSMKDLEDNIWEEFESWIRNYNKFNKSVSAKIVINYFNKLLLSK